MRADKVNTTPRALRNTEFRSHEKQKYGARQNAEGAWLTGLSISQDLYTGRQRLGFFYFRETVSSKTGSTFASVEPAHANPAN
jgi:hypothetical protein